MKCVENDLKPVLKPIHLWGISVGLVISGEYFGWSYGWALSGTVGFLISTIIVTFLYVTLIFSFTELSTSMPQSGGPFTYSLKAFGRMGGYITGCCTLIEFLFAPPAIAFALGSYLHFLYPSISSLSASIGSYLFFLGLNLFGIQMIARFELVVTLLAVAELILFMILTGPKFQMKNFMVDSFKQGWTGVFASIPFAIWFFLAIEGVSMTAEEVENPKRNIPIGFISGILTLVLLAFGVMFIAGGVGDWRLLAQRDYPLPEAMAMALGADSKWVKMLTGIGLFGLIASLNGIILGCSRQIYALAKEEFLPQPLAVVNRRFNSPHGALLAGGLIGIICLTSGKTDALITLSAIGAVSMYIFSMLALFVLRVKDPDMERPFPVPFYPWFPGIALALSCVCLVSLIFYHFNLFLIFIGLLLSAIILERVTHLTSNKRSKSQLSSTSERIPCNIPINPV